MFNRIHLPLGCMAPAKKDVPPAQAGGDSTKASAQNSESGSGAANSSEQSSQPHGGAKSEEKQGEPPEDPDGAAAADAPKMDAFAKEAAANVSSDIPAAAQDISEAEIREKVQAGLTRKQAIIVIQVQRDEDAAKAKAKKQGR